MDKRLIFIHQGKLHHKKIILELNLSYNDCIFWKHRKNGGWGGVIMIARTLFNDQPSYDMGSPDKVTEEESMNTIE